MLLTRGAVSNPVMVLMVCLAVVVLCAITVPRFPVDLFPQITIPALQVRRAETTVGMPSGGAIIMAGLIQERTRQALEGIPGAKDLPVFGPLFRSRDFVNNETELVIIVTPYVVKPVARRELSRPDDGFADPADPATVLLGRINRVYGNPALGDPRRAYHGKVGFIID